ncbi:hypothetical protein CDD83_8544 [Cordyceps sp. RAO-2017]|nr:hypothetical protein CDD83_8544 [Cordyceps sp. RAO-2017]
MIRRARLLGPMKSAWQASGPCQAATVAGGPTLDPTKIPDNRHRDRWKRAERGDYAVPHRDAAPSSSGQLLGNPRDRRPVSSPFRRRGIRKRRRRQTRARVSPPAASHGTDGLKRPADWPIGGPVQGMKATAPRAGGGATNSEGPADAMQILASTLSALSCPAPVRGKRTAAETGSTRLMPRPQLLLRFGRPSLSLRLRACPSSHSQHRLYELGLTRPLPAAIECAAPAITRTSSSPAYSVYLPRLLYLQRQSPVRHERRPRPRRPLHPPAPFFPSSSH